MCVSSLIIELETRFTPWGLWDLLFGGSCGLYYWNDCIQKRYWYCTFCVSL